MEGRHPQLLGHSAATNASVILQRLVLTRGVAFA